MKRTSIERRKPVKVWFPIQRILRGVDANGNEFRVPEGYAYVNAWVGDGFNLKRSAMLAASDDYMRWGAIREMHQPSAVGTAIGEATVARTDGQEGTETVPLGVFWDDKGAFLRGMVVDKDAIVKLDAGVYRGWSVAVAPTVMRGQDVETCVWIENSLVDRPADPDSALTLVRAENADPERATEVLRYWDENDNWVSGPYTFAQVLPQLTQEDLVDDLRAAFYALCDSCRTIIAGEGVDVSAMLDQTLTEFADYVRSSVFREFTTAGAERNADALISRLRSVSDLLRAGGSDARAEAINDLSTRLAGAEAETVAVRGLLETAQRERETLRADLSTARERVTQLEALPDPTQARPARYAASEREFLANRSQQTDPAATKPLVDELAELERTLKNEPDEEKRRAGVMRMQVIKQQIAAQPLAA